MAGKPPQALAGIRQGTGRMAGLRVESRPRPDGEIGRHKGLKICFVKSFLLSPPVRKVNSDNGLRAFKA
jgi:hypothetical protein